MGKKREPRVLQEEMKKKREEKWGRRRRESHNGKFELEIEYKSQLRVRLRGCCGTFFIDNGGNSIINNERILKP